jgi:hypothetical protein
VLVTVSDKKIAVASTTDPNLIAYYNADVVTANDYYPGGMQMPGRKYQASPTSTYRYSINGQEKESELNENITSALYWEYDSRIVRRWNTDPEGNDFESPYLCFNGNPIQMADPLGNKPTDIVYQDKKGKEIGRVADGSKKITVMQVNDPSQISISGGVPIMGPNYHEQQMGVYENEAEYQKSMTASPTSSSLNTKAATDQAPLNLANGVVREKYISDAKNLKPLYDNTNPSNPSNDIGIDKRTELKTNARKNSIAGGDKMLDVMEGPVKRPPTVNAEGNVPRFYKTRPSFNVISKVTTGMAILGTVVTIHRIATSDNKLREAAKVTAGIAGAWVSMKATAAVAGNIGIRVAMMTGNPVAGIVAAGLIQLASGAFGAFMGESLFDYFSPAAPLKR